MPWHYAIDGQQLGPVTDSEFDLLVKNGTIKPETRVWQSGMSDWQPYASVMSPGAGVDTGGADDSAVCYVSGKRYPKRAMIQYEGKWISAEHRDEFFQRLREGVAHPGTRVYGGFWRRFVAKMIDGIATGIISIPFNMAVAYMLFGTVNYFGAAPTQAGVQKAILFQAITIPVGIALALVYTCFFIRRFDATPGKMALGMKLLRADGSKLSIGRIIGRYFAELLSTMTLMIGYIIAGFDEEKRSLHDRICDTRVVKV